MDGFCKLVRDRVPQIIREHGSEPVTYTAGPEEYRSRLRDKLGEEVAEFLGADEAKAPEELADVLEVVRALAADMGIDAEQMEKIREAKARSGAVSPIGSSGQATTDRQPPWPPVGTPLLRARHRTRLDTLVC